MSPPPEDDLGENDVTRDDVNDAQGGEVSSPPGGRSLGETSAGTTLTRVADNLEAKRYFEKTLGVSRFVARWRRRYGDAEKEMTHVQAGIYLGGLHQYIDDARVELLEDELLGGRAHRVSAAAAGAPREVSVVVHGACVPLHQSSLVIVGHGTQCVDVGKDSGAQLVVHITRGVWR